MARALRDVTYPDRLKLYSNPEAFEQLNETVPWFTTLLKNVCGLPLYFRLLVTDKLVELNRSKLDSNSLAHRASFQWIHQLQKNLSRN